MASTTITTGALSATIDHAGAQLTSLALDGKEYLWQADPRWWDRQAPVLFPTVGLLRNNEATAAAGRVRLGRHGLARDYEHRVVNVSTDAVTFELTDSVETRDRFPYAFKLNMTYALTAPGSLTQTFRVENTGDVTLPFFVGGHPAFNIPVPTAPNEAFEDYRLEFAEPWSYASPLMTEDGLFTYDETIPLLDNSDTLPLTHRTFDVDTLVFADVPGSTVTLRGAVSGHGIRVDFEGFKYLGVWSAAGDAPFVALEPWTGHSTLASEDDVFEHKHNVTLLEPGAVDERSFTITIL